MYVRRCGLVAMVLGSAGLCACTEPMGDEPVVPPVCEEATYRIASVDLADTWGDAARLALDVDGDGVAENKLGSLNATLTQVYGDWAPGPALDAALAGSTAWLVRTVRCDARLEVSLGAGRVTGGQVVDPSWGEPAVGAVMEARGGVGVLPAGRLGDGASAAVDDGWAEGLALRVALRSAPPGLAGTLGLGIEVDDTLLAPVAAFLSRALAAGDSRFAAGLDLDRDGAVSVAELRQAPAVRTLLAADLDLTAPCATGACPPGGDGVDEHISLGLGFTARPIELR